MKAVARNISKHENGYLYLRARIGGKPVLKSLGTRDLVEAKRLVFEGGYQGILERTVERVPVSVPQVASSSVEAPTKRVSWKEALDQFDMRTVKASDSAEEMARRCRKAIEQYAQGTLAEFSPAAVWTQYRNNGLKANKPKANKLGANKGKKRRVKVKKIKKEKSVVTSAANHLKWYLVAFVKFGVKRGYFHADLMEEFEQIPSIEISPRRIRVPEVSVVKELLDMVATEDEDGAEWFRFLASSGLRRAGALGLTWNKIDIPGKRMVALMKCKGGHREVSLPLTPEALEILKKRKALELPKPWPFTEYRLRRSDRVLKKFAKGMDLDLRFNHAFRHYFASHALGSGLTVQEVALLLGHKDQGQLVLRIYGHLQAGRLDGMVAKLRLITPPPQQPPPQENEGRL